MTSHDATIQTMSHLSAFLKKACKISAFLHIHKYLCKKVHFYANFVGYWLISNGKEPMSSPSTKKSAVYQPICRISSTSQ